MTAENLKHLLSLPESDTLDFKRDQYALQKGSEHSRSEFIKDILAFANTIRSKDALIIIGVEETATGQHNVKGISGPLVGADIQQLVNEKTNRPVAFRYEHVDYEGVKLGVIRIERFQPRPIYLRNDYGSLRSNIVYQRRDSSTAQATPDDVLQMRQLPVVALTNGEEGNPAIRQMATRWLRVFDEHQILRSQIGQILRHPELAAAHFQNEKTLLPILTDSLIDEVCWHFNINRAWIEGESKSPYSPLYLDSQLKAILRGMVAMRQRSRQSWIIGIKTRLQDLEKSPHQVVGVLIRSCVTELNNRNVECYMPIDTNSNCSWSERKFRWFLKRIFMAARYLGMSFSGCTLDCRHVVKIGEGEIFPEKIIHKYDRGYWHPDDFIYGPEESAVAKESEDLHALRDWCEKTGDIDSFREARRSIPELEGDDPPVRLL